MYYYQYPTKKTKKVTGYTKEGSSINSQTNVDLPAITFKWAQMKKTYSSGDVGSTSETAVSQLMKYVGWAAKMNYGLKASAANEYTMAKGMVEFFDYDPYTLSYEARDAYSVSEWDALIYGELAAGRPVLRRERGFRGNRRGGNHCPRNGRPYIG